MCGGGSAHSTGSSSRRTSTIGTTPTSATRCNTNYAGLLPVWDQLFGTYHMPTDRRPSRYGIDEPMPLGVWGQLRQPFRRRPDVTPKMTVAG